MPTRIPGILLKQNQSIRKFNPDRHAADIVTFPSMAWRLWAACFALIVVGCAKPSSVNLNLDAYDSGDAEEASEAPAPMAATASSEAAPPPRARAHKRAMGGSGAIDAVLANQSAPDLASATEPSHPVPASPASKRMVHYSGRATLRSTEPDRILDSAIALVQASGGYLEQRSGRFAALRVPAPLFDSLFVRLMRLAEVVDFSQEAEDITEAFQDTEMRLRLVIATLERLEALVQKAKTESQKLRLLRELKRLREEREVLDSRKRELVQKARFASIHLWLQDHTPVVAGEAWRRDLADFKWIHRLNPFDDGRFRGRSTLDFPVPPGMVVSRKRSPWRATGSQGAEFWGSEMEVDPIGDSRFWIEAIRNRLKDGFKQVSTQEAGTFRFCRFQSYGPKPYFYWVGVRARGDELDLAEFYFPDEDQQNRLLPDLLAAVEKKSK